MKKKKVQIEAWENIPKNLPPDEIASMLEEFKKTGNQKIREEIALNMRRFICFFVSKVYQGELSEKEDKEDVYQDLMEVTLKCVDKFTKTNFNFSFTTYVSKYYMAYFGNKRREKSRQKRNAIVVSLDDKVRYRDKQIPLEEFVSADNNFLENLHDELDVKLVKEKILPLLSKEEREIFTNYFFKQLPLDKLSINYTREGKKLILDRVVEKVINLYNDGITETDKAMMGVVLTAPQKKMFVCSQAILKKYGREFLEEVFLPRLTKKQAEIFKDNILSFNGTIKTNDSVSETITLFQDKLKMLEPEFKRYMSLKEETPLKQRQRKERNGRLIEEYGGNLFLRKYFLPLLSEQEKKVFELAILNYSRGTSEDLARRAEMNLITFNNTLSNSLNKLKNVDFEVLVDVVDNASKSKVALKSTSLATFDKVKERQELVKKYGGKEFLKEIFSPLLTDSQKKVFDALFLYPHVFTYAEVAEELNYAVPSIISTEKVIVEKLKNTNFTLLRKINKDMEKKLKYEEYACTKNAKSKITQKIEQFGGRDFLLEKFAPALKIKAHKIIFEKYMCGTVSKNALEEKLKLRGDYSSRYFNFTVNSIINKLEEFKKSFGSEENFQKAVKDFYVAKEYENQSDKKMKEEKRLLTDEEVEKYGGKRLLGRKFLRTLPVLDQLILYASLFKNKNLSEIKKELKLTYADMNYHTKQIKSKLEKFKEENEKK